MNDLKHWLDDASDANDFERSVLRSGLNVDPPRGKESEVWSNLVGALAIAPVAAGVAPAAQGAGIKTAVGGASKAAAVWLGVGKGFVVGLAVYGAAAGVSEISDRLAGSPPVVAGETSNAAAPRAKAPQRLAPSAVPPSAVPPLAAPDPLAAESTPATSATPNAASASHLVAPSTSAPPLPSVAAFPEPSGAARESQLRAEAAALRSARAALRAGNLSEALATLEASQRQFAAPELYQEREALLIELLFRSGQTAAARERARAFLTRFPESPHAGPIRQLVER